jgi:small subunit ribosomal protein MRP21
MIRGAARTVLRLQPSLLQRTLHASQPSIRLFQSNRSLYEQSNDDSKWQDLISGRSRSPSSSGSPTNDKTAKEENSTTLTPSSSSSQSPFVNDSWKSVLDSFTNNSGSRNSLGPFSDDSDSNIKMMTSANQVLDPIVEFEELWKNREIRGPPKPGKPRDGRTVDIDQNTDFQRTFQILNSILGRNNIRHELRMGERYEKPNQKRRRLRSERHRRRFADAVKQKVELVSKEGREVESKAHTQSVDMHSEISLRHLQIMELKSRGA